MNKEVSYTIVSKPDYIIFDCPHCNERVEVPFDGVDYNTDCWCDGAWTDCPECGEEVALGDWEYD